MGNSSLRILPLALLLLGLSSWADGYCRQGGEWMEHNGFCYHWTRETANWFKAELNCKRFGGSLASVRTPDENAFLLKLTQCSSNFWIGLVNTIPSQRGFSKGYEWFDGTQHNYTTMSITNADYRDCVYFGYDGVWYNSFCPSLFPYVCKAAAASMDERTDVTWAPRIQADKDREAAVVNNGGNSNLAPRLTTEKPAQCQTGWVQLDSSCYFHSPNKTNYFNAQMSCQAMGASVTSVLTPREHTLLTLQLGCRSPTWIGLEKARPCFKQPNKDHCWVWMDRSPVNYMEWASGQSVDRRDAECVILDGQWKAINCYNEYRYLCKKPMYAAA